jgi:putative acetyltransferase
VHPDRQGNGVGSTLMTALATAASAAGEPALVLLGDPAFYGRFGFRPAAEFGIAAPDPAWGAHFQVLALRPDRPPPEGRFTYAAPFGRL